MSNPLFGTKHVCEACSERFYDLNKVPAVCFKCSAVQAPPQPRMYRPMRASSPRGAFNRRQQPVLAEEKQDEPAEDLVVEDAEAEENEDAEFDDDTEVEIEVEIDPEDGKVIV